MNNEGECSQKEFGTIKTQKVDSDTDMMKHMFHSVIGDLYKWCHGPEFEHKEISKESEHDKISKESENEICNIDDEVMKAFLDYEREFFERECGILKLSEEDYEIDSDSLKFFDLAKNKEIEGDKFLLEQKWDDAIKCYTSSIEFYSFDPVVYINRAKCYLKIKKFKEAEKDCDQALNFDKINIKGYVMRANARANQNNSEGANLDLLRFRVLDRRAGKNVVSLARFISKRRQKMLMDKKPFTWKPIDGIIPVTTIQKAPHLRSEKPLRRIIIEEIKSLQPQRTSIKVDKKMLGYLTMARKFTLKWKYLDYGTKCRELKKIPPRFIPFVFKNALSFTVFSDLLKIFALYFTERDDNVYEYVYFLAQVGIISVMALFMTKRDKKNMQRILIRIEAFEEHPKEKIEELIKLYELNEKF